MEGLTVTGRGASKKKIVDLIDFEFFLLLFHLFFKASRK